jgi:hypothetical protein
MSYFPRISALGLDGVIQAGGGPEEDTSGGFAYGGWQAPYSDDVSGKWGFLHTPPKRCTRLHLGISFVHHREDGVMG